LELSTFSLLSTPLLYKYQEYNRGYVSHLPTFCIYVKRPVIDSFCFLTITEKNVPALKAVTPRMKFAVTGAGTAVGVLGALTYALAQENYTLGYISDYIRHQLYEVKEKFFGQDNQ
jgi:hypothetical protein